MENEKMEKCIAVMHWIVSIHMWYELKWSQIIFFAVMFVSCPTFDGDNRTDRKVI